MNRDYKHKLKIAAIWFFINTAIGMVIFAILSSSHKNNILNVFLLSMINAHIISSLTAFTGYRIGRVIRDKWLVSSLLILLSGTLLASTAASLLCTVVVNSMFKFKTSAGGYFSSWRIIPVLTISATVTAVTISIERLRRINAEKDRELYSAKTALENSEQRKHAVFTLRDNEFHQVINQNDIIYLSSHGKKTSFHTVTRDYESSQLLREVEEKLPAENFVRIHKQFLINISFLESIKYHEGGRYMAYLKDDDESMLPVGRKFVPLLKNRLGLKI